jgi:hypothetical protein
MQKEAYWNSFVILAHAEDTEDGAEKLQKLTNTINWQNNQFLVPTKIILVSSSLKKWPPSLILFILKIDITWDPFIPPPPHPPTPQQISYFYCFNSYFILLFYVIVVFA